MLRGAIIGLGNVAVHGHVPGWRARPDVQIAAATDADPARRAAMAEHLPGCRWYDSAEELMDEATLDFVDICTPPSSHAALVGQAFARGLHALCEKPLVGTPEELSALAEQAAARQLVLQSVHNWHQAPIVRQTQALLNDGAIGRPTGATWHTLRTRPAAAAGGAQQNWRVDPAIAGGGVLTDHGWHVSYLLHRWVGAAPVAVSARLETRRHREWAVEDTATMTLTFPGARASVLLTWAADERRNWAEITGADGSIELADDTLVLRSGGFERRWSFASGLSDGSQHPDWFHAVAAAFLGEIAGDAGESGNLDEAWTCAAVDSVARESNRRGGVEMPLPAPLRPLGRELSV